ncbi:MAG TPA: lytic transglycosylase domain-containing protein [Thermoanaerobaculia bacterium]|nr:lytic transglycosylase domain-containing protein [Thermoanaerobaculia bacterium]
MNKRALAIGCAVLGACSTLFAGPHPQTAPARPSAAVRAALTLPRLAANGFPIPVPIYLSKAIADASATYRVDPNLIAAMAFRESAFNASAVSSRGAQGIMQLMPNTARVLGVDNAFDARQNVFAGTKYIASLLQRFDGNVPMALAAYNAGPELVSKVGPSATQEAVEYVAAVTGYYRDALRALD